jgi:phosphoribosylformimino-5-aminoimidazole carboxamide ribotide isomerase
MEANRVGQVIITSFLFPNGSFSLERLKQTLDGLNGEKSKLVIDLSCRAKDGKWFVAMNKWQTITDFEVNQGKITYPLLSYM